MAETSIEWADFSWNPLRGCSETSPGCLNCYAAVQAWRFAGPGQPYEGLVEKRPNGKVVWTGRLREVPSKLAEPLHWRKPRKVFVNSMSDLFHEDVSDEFIAAVFAVMAAGWGNTYQVLTKRASRMRDWMAMASETPAEVLTRGLEVLSWDDDFTCGVANFVNGWSRWKGMPDDGNPLDGSVPRWPLPNVWLGVSVEDQKRADERIPCLLATPAAVRFLSCEPLLGSVDLTRIPGFFFPGATTHDALSGRLYHHDDGDQWTANRRLSWVIVGGESGDGARPCDLAWIRSIVRQCEAAGVPCFVKQLGSRPIGAWQRLGGTDSLAVSQPFFAGHWHLNDHKGGDPSEWPEDLRVRQFPEVAHAA